MQKTGKPTVCSHSFHLCASIHSCFISSNKFFNSLVHPYLTHCNTDNEKGDQGLNYTYWGQSTLLSVFWSCFRMLALSSVPDSFFSSFLLSMSQSRRKQKQQHQNSFVYLKMSNIITSFWVGTLEMQSLSLSLSLSQSHIPVPTLSKTLFHPWNTFASYILEIVHCHSAIWSKAQPHSRAKVFGISK